MDDLYLIAHKVRGKPAFDIAIQMKVEDEVWWIIPTSGHRAYPYDSQPLSELIELADWPEMPSDLPDHYTTRASPAERTAEGQSLLAKLGLTRKTPFTDRRV